MNGFLCRLAVARSRWIVGPTIIEMHGQSGFPSQLAQLQSPPVAVSLPFTCWCWSAQTFQLLFQESLARCFVTDTVTNRSEAAVKNLPIFDRTHTLSVDTEQPSPTGFSEGPCGGK